MATEAPNWYVTKYIDRAIEIFQAKGYMLRGTVSEPAKITGNQVTWFVGGRGEAVPLQRGAFGPAMNAARGTITQTMTDWQANAWVYETDLEKMTANESEMVSKECGYALGRRSDLLIQNELNASALTMVGDGTSAFTLVMALTGIQLLQAADVEFEGDIYCMLPPLAWQQFLSYRQVNDADWVGYDGLPYKTGAKMKDWNGVRWFRGPTQYFPVPAANQQDFFMWAKPAVGYGSNYELRSTVTWENLYTGWYHNNRFAANAKMLQLPGAIRFRYASNSPITIN